MNKAGASIRHVSSARDPIFELVLELYRNSFPAAERDPEDHLREEANGNSRLRAVYLVAERQDDLLGFVRFVELRSISSVWAIHLAVVPKVKGQGIGALLVQAMQDDHPEWTILAEVERVADAQDAEDMASRERRLSWFSKLGATLVTPEYTQPSLGPSLAAVPLNLLRIGGTSLAPQDIILGLYQEGWQLAAEHEYVVRAIAGIPD